MQRLERDGRIVRRALLPAPREDADPWACQGPHGGLMGLALVALLLGVHLCPEGMSDRLRRPCDQCLPEALGTREAPVPPGLRATPFGPRGAPGIFWECGGGGRACALCAEGAEQPGGADGARAWEGLAQGAIGKVLSALRHGGVAIGDGVQGDTELGNEGLPQERIGHDDACIGRAGCGGCAGLETLGDDLGIAHVMRPEAGCEGGTASALHRLEGRPATQEVAKERGVLLLQPVEHVRERVLEGPGEAVGAPHFVADHAAPVCDELGEGAPRRALRLERLQRVAMAEQQCELEAFTCCGASRLEAHIMCGLSPVETNKSRQGGV
jgi:hypothetical protein